MSKQNLVQYVFEDGSETIATQTGRVVAVRDSHVSEDYLPLKMWPKPYIQGSIPELGSDKFSRTPKVDERLLTARLLGFGQRLSASPIREINPNFQRS